MGSVRLGVLDLYRGRAGAHTAQEQAEPSGVSLTSALIMVRLCDDDGISRETDGTG